VYLWLLVARDAVLKTYCLRATHPSRACGTRSRLHKLASFAHLLFHHPPPFGLPLSPDILTPSTKRRPLLAPSSLPHRPTFHFLGILGGKVATARLMRLAINAYKTCIGPPTNPISNPNPISHAWRSIYRLMTLNNDKGFQSLETIGT